MKIDEVKIGMVLYDVDDDRCIVTDIYYNEEHQDQGPMVKVEYTNIKDIKNGKEVTFTTYWSVDDLSEDLAEADLTWFDIPLW